MTIILAGDIGGTRSRFALCDAKTRKIVHQDVLESRSYATFEKALERFLDDAKKAVKTKIRPPAATFGIAGPVVDQRVKTTNLPWVIDANAIERSFSIGNVTLFNDLVTIGFGALACPPSKVRTIHGGRPKKTGGNLAVIAAGTGLGEAAFVWHGDRHIPCPTEGAHVDFAPRTSVEAELLASLRSEHGHVSYERVASGSTIGALYRFFVHEQGVKESKEAAATIAQAPDPNPAIVEPPRRERARPRCARSSSGAASTAPRPETSP
jgi:glucokinase